LRPNAIWKTAPAISLPRPIIFATLWGLALKEWHGTSRRTKLLVTAGLALLIGSTIIVGYGNYLKASQEAPASVSLR